jgi:hypothetical protein
MERFAEVVCRDIKMLVKALQREHVIGLHGFLDDALSPYRLIVALIKLFEPLCELLLEGVDALSVTAGNRC